MAKWLSGICVAEAARNPGDHHAACLVLQGVALHGSRVMVPYNILYHLGFVRLSSST